MLAQEGDREQARNEAPRRGVCRQTLGVRFQAFLADVAERAGCFEPEGGTRLFRQGQLTQPAGRLLVAKRGQALHGKEEAVLRCRGIGEALAPDVARGAIAPPCQRRLDEMAQVAAFGLGVLEYFRSTWRSAPASWSPFP
jgi:hypothetical protein